MRVAPAGIVALAFLCGCTCGGPKIGETVDYNQEFFPEQWKHAPVLWQVGDLKADAAVELKTDGQKREIAIVYEGKVVEREGYIANTKEVALVYWIDPAERFDPPIPLLKFPMPVESEWEWKGKHIIGPRELDAQAKIKTSKDRLELAIGSVEAVKVVVTLKTLDGSGNEKERELRFWFAPGLGPVRREYGVGQVREPRRATEAETRGGEETKGDG
ncbi:MAG: hypothetical protein D6724_04095 [Armatimonadetes bacterium]|nr:MAG: hypothetical protein D6724_04095 [Armatimonadota bacterium]